MVPSASGGTAPGMLRKEMEASVAGPERAGQCGYEHLAGQEAAPHRRQRGQMLSVEEPQKVPALTRSALNIHRGQRKLY